MEDLELLLARAKRHLAVDLVVDSFGIGERTTVLPVRPECCHELSPIDHAIAVVKLVRYSVHLEAGRRELVLQDAVNKVLPAKFNVTIKFVNKKS